MMRTFGQINPVQVIRDIAQQSRSGAQEVQQYYIKTLNFVHNHTSAEGLRAINIALNETRNYFLP